MFSYVRFLMVAILSIFLKLTGPYVQAQQARKPITITGKSLEGKYLFLLSESHSIEEKNDFYNSLIPYLVSTYNVTDIVLETSHSEAFLINSYFRDEDSTILIYNRDSVSLAHLEHAKMAWMSLPPEKRYIFHGMDFERMEFVPVTLKLLSVSETGRKTALYQYLQSIPDSMYFKVHRTPSQISLRKETYEKARSIYKKDKHRLKSIGANSNVLSKIFENPTRETKFSKRDRGMYLNIREETGGRAFVCIAGSYHFLYRRGTVYPSLLKLISHHTDHSKRQIAVVDLVSNRKYLYKMQGTPEEEPPKSTEGPVGPGYFVCHPEAVKLGHSKHCHTDFYELVYKDIFNPPVHKDNHGFDSWYVFLGDCEK